MKEINKVINLTMILLRKDVRMPYIQRKPGGNGLPKKPSLPNRLQREL